MKTTSPSHIVALAVVCSLLGAVGCGEEPPFIETEPQPASAYAPFFDRWNGVVSGVTSRRQVISIDIAMSLWGDGDVAMLRGLCDGLAVDLQAYQQRPDSIRFMGGTVACTIQTECGETTARIGGVTLTPIDLEQVAIQMSIGFKACAGQRDETILMSGILVR